MKHRAFAFASIIIVIALGASCGRSVERTTAAYNDSPDRKESPSPYGVSKTQDPSALCNRISEIKILPMKGEKGDDATYDDFMKAGDAVVPCLIERVTDTTKMRDPRQEPGYPDVEIRIGDIAFFLMVDITKIPFTEPLPAEVQKEYAEDGVYAYFKFVKKPENRKKLQDALRTWRQGKQKNF
jgi:hypothetical protein